MLRVPWALPPPGGWRGEGVPPLAVLEPTVELRAKGARTLDGNHGLDAKARVLKLAAELVGMVKVGGREPFRPGLGLWVAMLAVANVALDDVLGPGVCQEPPASPSKVDAKRETAAATRRPPGRRTRRASPSAASRASRSVRWYRGPNSSAASALASA